MTQEMTQEMKNNVPLGCGAPWIKNFLQGILNANSKFPDISQNNFKQIAKWLNDITDKHQEIMNQSDELFMTEFEDIKKFFNTSNRFCDILNSYATSIRDKSLDKDKLQTYFQTIQFYYSDQFIVSYQKAKNLLNERRKPSNKKWSPFFGGPMMNILTRLWELKIYIYIIGNLYYNINLYSFPAPITSMLDNIIRLFGILCFSISKDPILLVTFLRSLNKIITNSIISIFNIVSSILGKVFQSKILQLVNILMFYGFTYYTIDWLSKIFLAICQTMTVLKPSILATQAVGGSSLEYIKTQGQEIIQYTIQSTIQYTGKFVELAAQALPAILAGFGQFYTNYIINQASSFWNSFRSQIKNPFIELTNTMMAFWKSPSTDLVAREWSVSTPIKQKIPIPKGLIDILKELGYKDEVTSPLVSYDDGVITLDDGGVITLDDDGVVTLDLDIFSEKIIKGLTEGIKNQWTKIEEGTGKKIINDFNNYYEKILKTAGLTALVTAMGNFDQNITFWNQPLVVFFLMSEEVLGTFITNNSNLTIKILCCIIMISLFIGNLW
jgi:hypothetical protein